MCLKQYCNLSLFKYMHFFKCIYFILSIYVSFFDITIISICLMDPKQNKHFDADTVNNLNENLEKLT